MQRIFAYLTFLFNKYDYKRVVSLTKKTRYNSDSNDETICKFFQLTNKRTAEWLSLQYELSKIHYDVKYHYFDEVECLEQLDKATIQTKNNFYEISNINTAQPKCTCYQMKTMNLPCRHIFKCRSDLNLTLIENGMIENARHNIISKDLDEINASSDTETVKHISDLNKHKKTSNLTVKEKYNLAWNPIKELTSALSHLNDEDFDEQFTLVLHVKSLIENKAKFKIIQVDELESIVDNDLNNSIVISSNTNEIIDSHSNVQMETVRHEQSNFEVSQLNLLKGNPIGAKKKPRKYNTFD